MLVWRLLFLILNLSFLPFCFSEYSDELEIFKFFELILDDKNKNLSDDQHSFLKNCLAGQPESIYKAARQISQRDTALLGNKNLPLAIKMFHYLADTKVHVDSCVNLGEIYSESEQLRSTSKAFAYFERAGMEGHHSSLYNAGRLLNQGMTESDLIAVQNGRAKETDFLEKDLIGAMAYFQAAAKLHESYPEDSNTGITELSRQALEALSITAVATDMSIRQTADAFIFGSLHEIPSGVEVLWRKAISSLVQTNETFVESKGETRDMTQMVSAFETLKDIIDDHSEDLSEFQSVLTLYYVNDILGGLTGINDTYLQDAARYAEMLAFSTLCMAQFATSERDSSCFNEAASSAVSYYRRSGSFDDAERVRIMANNHPHASTHWKTIKQTPRIYDPNLTAKAWWNADDFSAASSLQKKYKSDKERLIVIKELEKLVLYSKRVSVGLELFEGSNKVEGFRRIYSSRLRLNEDEWDGLAEFGPLFDGDEWSEERCKMIPSVCNALRADLSICSTDGCDSDGGVTILRLRPGFTILPHSGTTNSRLLLHFPLVGVENVKVTVDSVEVENYSRGIVFDDSFEHTIYHGGTQDLFYVSAILTHPDL